MSDPIVWIFAVIIVILFVIFQKFFRASFWFAIGKIFSLGKKTGMQETAERFFLKANQANACPAACIGLGEVYCRLRRYQEAERWLKKYRDARGWEADLIPEKFFKYGQLALENGDDLDAKAFFLQAAKDGTCDLEAKALEMVLEIDQKNFNRPLDIAA